MVEPLANTHNALRTGKQQSRVTRLLAGVVCLSPVLFVGPMGMGDGPFRQMGVSVWTLSMYTNAHDAIYSCALDFVVFAVVQRPVWCVGHVGLPPPPSAGALSSSVEAHNL